MITMGFQPGHKLVMKDVILFPGIPDLVVKVIFYMLIIRVYFSAAFVIQGKYRFKT